LASSHAGSLRCAPSAADEPLSQAALPEPPLRRRTCSLPPSRAALRRPFNRFGRGGGSPLSRIVVEAPVVGRRNLQTAISTRRTRRGERSGGRPRPLPASTRAIIRPRRPHPRPGEPIRGPDPRPSGLSRPLQLRSCTISSREVDRGSRSRDPRHTADASRAPSPAPELTLSSTTGGISGFGTCAAASDLLELFCQHAGRARRANGLNPVNHFSYRITPRA